MAAPELTPVGAQVYDDLTPLATEDEANGWPLATFVSALALMFDDLHLITSDSEDGPGYSIIMDPDRTPLPWLPWLAQFKGATVPAGLDESAARLRVREADGADRGSVRSLTAIAKGHLTGTQTVYFQERVGGDADVAALSTWASETPDPDALKAAVLADKPGGLILTVDTVTGGDFDTLRDTHASFDVVTATYATFDDLRADPARQ